MEKQGPMQFSVLITSTYNHTWQGVVEAGGKSCFFQSEMQMLKWIWQQYPVLMPDGPDQPDIPQKGI